MYAVLQTGGKQYKVSPGDKIEIEKLKATVGDQIEFDNILMIADGKKIIVEPNKLEKSKIVGEVIDQGRAKKIIVFKSKRKKGYKRKKGHRQYLTKVEIKDITP